MITLSERIVGPVVLTEDAELEGMVVGSLTVRGGVHLDLSGLVTGDLIVEAGATVEIGGMVDGTVVNRGGEVVIYGTVEAVAGTHPCRIAEGGVIRS